MTTVEVKTILGLSDSSHDTQIAYLLPLVERDVIEYLGHAYQDGRIYRESASDLKFYRGDSTTADYVEDGSEKFKEVGFLDGMDVVVEGGWSNVGMYTIASASTDRLVMTGRRKFVDQDLSDEHVGLVRISRVRWPESLKLIVAKMVWALIEDPRPNDAISESLDDYSITYAGKNAYPTRLINGLGNFRKPVFR